MARSFEVMEQLQSLVFDLKAIFRKKIEQSDILVPPMHARMLKVIGLRPGITQQEIVALAGRDKAQIARLIKELLSKELIDKKQDQQDKRIYRLYLTMEAREIVDTVMAVQTQVADHFFAKLSADESDEFKRLLDKIQAGLEVDKETS